jgi:hypothetical protein
MGSCVMSVGIQVYSRRVKWAYVRKLLMSQVLSALKDDVFVR